MKLLKYLYEKIYQREAPYYYNYSLATIIKKPIRKFVANVIAPNCPFSNLRVCIYRLCGFKIGSNTFIGMKCYLDNMCFDLMEIGNNVTISYGVYFACHGKNQGHYPIIIKDNAYIGMRAMVISKNHKSENNFVGVTVGNRAIVGAGTLVNKDVPDDGIAVGVPCRILDKGKNND